MAYYKFTKEALNNQEITLFNKGEHSRDMTFIDDVVCGILGAISYLDKSKNKHEIFNLGNSTPVKTKKLLQLIEERFNINCRIKHINTSKEAKITLADCSKSKILLGYHPKVPVELGMEAFFDWFVRYLRYSYQLAGGEIGDTRDLKSLEGNFVPVQVRPWAPF